MPRPSKAPKPRQPIRPPAVVAAFEEASHRITQGGVQLDEAALEGIRAAGSRAAEEGMTAGAAVDLYLAAAARAWSAMPPPNQKEAAVVAQTTVDLTEAQERPNLEWATERARSLVQVGPHWTWRQLLVETYRIEQLAKGSTRTTCGIRIP